MSIPGQITARLLAQLAPDDPAWTPVRASYARPMPATCTGWHCTGRSLPDRPTDPRAGRGSTPGEASRTGEGSAVSPGPATRTDQHRREVHMRIQPGRPGSPPPPPRPPSQPKPIPAP